MSRLIKQAKHSPKAFTKLYELHVNAVYQYCAYRTHSTEEAEDLCSEVWESVLKHIQELESDHPTIFKGWLFTIARHCVYKHWKNRKSPDSLDETSCQIPSPEAGPAERSEAEESAAHLRELVKALPQQQQEAVSLRFFSGLRNKEIAAALELSEKTVASNLSRALDTLHLWLKKLQ
ncbi:sigma-70 family RNA polymerase sigma factor [Candidatus Peregrinibacteria bacterium]|nr:MAG: sigma-70 family RNA polymerase sigma factor [Candidatus Peregrinibacteria bacterium]